MTELIDDKIVGRRLFSYRIIDYGRTTLVQPPLDNKIRKHFATDTIINYRSRSGIVHAEDKDIIRFINKTSSSDSKVLEVGGGSGALLDLIAAASSVSSLYNCEFVPEAYKLQANPSINLIGSTALNLPFQDQTFDYCIAKNLLHHLVGATRNKSKENAARAVEELVRVCKHEGFVILLEQYNRCSVCASLIFYATLFLSHIGVSLRLFGVGKNVIVSFLTPGEIQKLLCRQKKGKVFLLKSANNNETVEMRYKFSLLMSYTGIALLIARIDKLES